jgi:hypothetical protein
MTIAQTREYIFRILVFERLDCGPARLKRSPGFVDATIDLALVIWEKKNGIGEAVEPINGNISIILTTITHPVG